ncbi:MAG: demethoxyubiquinone hydroxylase family protein [Azospirillaceae bacterium]
MTVRTADIPRASANDDMTPGSDRSDGPDSAVGAEGNLAARAWRRRWGRAPTPRPLPGDPDRRRRLERLMRVDLAGEYGAKRIYEGQLAILGDTEDGPLLVHMAEQEAVHLATFQRLLPEHGVRPTALHPLWHAAGFALGAGTALMGRRAAMACTVAVEEVIDRHYADQIDRLDDTEAGDAALRATLERFRAEELEHRDIGLDNEAEKAPGYRLLTAAIKTGSRLAIRLSERV